jgi:hypothetical protein
MKQQSRLQVSFLFSMNWSGHKASNEERQEVGCPSKLPVSGSIPLHWDGTVNKVTGYYTTEVRFLAEVGIFLLETTPGPAPQLSRSSG